MKQLNFPDLRQINNYDCGANALQAVLAYYGIEVGEELLLKLAKTDRRKGTTIAGMLNVLKKYGLKFDSDSMTIESLKKYISKEIPVIVLLQAWGKKSVQYANDYHDGHWVVAIGYDDKKIFFEDPYTFKRTFLSNQELEDRWHAKEGDKKVINHGIAVYGKKPTYNYKKLIHMD